MGRVTPVASWIGALLMAVLLGACGSSEPAPRVEEDGRVWHHDGPQRGAPWGVTRREFVSIRLPEARNVALDDSDEALPRFVMNVQADQSITFRGSTFSLAGDVRDRRAAVEAMGRELTRLHREPRWRRPDGWSRLPVLVHADRATRWPTVAAVVAVLTQPDVRVDRLQLAVLRFTAADWDMRIHGRLTPMETEAPDVVLTLRGRDEGELRWVQVDVARDATRSTVRFPRAQDLDDVSGSLPDREAWFEEANRDWERVDVGIAEVLRPGDRVAIRVPPPGRVELAYVVTTIDLLLGHDVHDIAFPEQGFRIVFGEHRDGEPPALPSDLGRLPVWLGLLVAVLAFGLPLLGFAGRRSRKRGTGA